jgi:iron complex transport system substrate-binding protein
MAAGAAFFAGGNLLLPMEQPLEGQMKRRFPMKKSLRFLAVLALALFLCLPAFAVTVTDLKGREVDVSSAQRIVSLTPSNTEILFALGLGDRVVGVDASSNYPAEAAVLPKCGDYAGPNAEMIISLKPDLVLAGNKLQADAIAQLEGLGLTVLAAEADTYAGIPDSIRLIASAAGADPTPLLNDMAQKEQAILTAVAGKTPSTVYYAVSFGDWGDYTVGPGSFIYEILEKIGAVPVTSDSPVAWPMYSLEQIVNKNPQVILLGDDETRGAEIYVQEGYKDLPAVKAGRVYLINPDMSGRPAPRVLGAMEQMAEAIYGIEIPD